MPETTPEPQNETTPAEDQRDSRADQRGSRVAQRASLAALSLVALAFVVFSNCGPSDSTANTNFARAEATPKIVSGGNGNAAPAPREGVASPMAAGSPVPLPDELKTAQLKTLDGAAFDLGDYQGKVVVLNFWASWCNPCRAEIPQIVALYDDYKSRDVEVLGVTLEDPNNNTAEDVRSFVRDLKVNYRIAWAERDFYATFLAPGYQIPQTYIIDRQGRIRKKFLGGGSLVGKSIRAVIDDILAEKQG